jgi:hypothetical protein
MRSPERVIRRLLALGLVTEKELRPCSEKDIAKLERRHGVILPEAYRLYLRRMGRGAGRFFTSDHWYAGYDSVFKSLGTRCDAKPEGPLPEKAFVFATRMGDYYCYFVADGKDEDPAVLGWGDCGKVTRWAGSFWQWLDGLIGDYEQLLQSQ